MKFKRFLRHSNTINHCLVVLVLGLALGLFATNVILKVLGFGSVGLCLLLIVMAAAEMERLFWQSQLEWWDENDTRFEDWKRGI
jgi:uncharacterized membrane protein